MLAFRKTDFALLRINPGLFLINLFSLPSMAQLLDQVSAARYFRCEENKVAFTPVQTRFFRVRQVEPCHKLGWGSQALFLSNLAPGAMLKQPQQQRWQRSSTDGTQSPRLTHRMRRMLSLSKTSNILSSATRTGHVSPPWSKMERTTAWKALSFVRNDI